MGALPFLDRRAGACCQLVQLDVALFPASPNPTLHPHTRRYWPARLELCRSTVEWSCDGWCSGASRQDCGECGDLVYSSLWHLFHGRL